MGWVWKILILVAHKIRNLLSKRRYKFIVAVLIICLTVRLLPYLVPVRSADIRQTQLAWEFRDRNGLPLGTLLTRDREHTTVVPLNQVSPHFIQAILAAEDKRFYQHGALDLQAVARAIKDAIHKQRIVSGASTITMQLARMLDPTPRNITGKVQEIWLSWRLTAGMNKDEILFAYINRLPMGSNIYGVEAAARIYFSIPAQELNLAQASLLAALPNNPNYFDPHRHWQRLKKRQKYVLDRMVEDGYINDAEAQRAYSENVVFQSRRQGIIAAPHFLFWLASQPDLNNQKEKISAPIHTTIDRPLQQFVEAQVQQVVDSLADNNVYHAAALVISNHTGEVVAYVGSPDYFDTSNQGRNDGVQALRQPGSTLKPFLYELALEGGVIRPNTILADVPAHYAIPGAKLYSPTDYDETFLGPVRVRVALANSLNVPAVRILEKVGVGTFLERLHQLGFAHLTQSPEYYGLGLSLGSGEVSLWELARAYMTMARQGQAIPLVTKLSPSSTNNDRSSVQNANTWQLIIDILSDRHARATAFGVDSVLNLPFPAAVKTGTSSNFRDTWTVGFTTDYTVATWVGNFDGTPMNQVSGVMGAAPLWNRIMLHLHSSQVPEKFSSPPTMVKLPICATSGLKPTPGCSSVVQEYFYPEDISKYQRQQDFKLPPEYDEWLAQQGQSRLNAGKLRIVSPRNGDLFLLYPGDITRQKLEFKVSGQITQPVEWWLNHQKLTTNSDNSHLFWTLRPGEWNLQVKSGDMMDKVTFQVQPAKNKSGDRGFSLVEDKATLDH
ncbi:MAG: penicillin-binding protein 1C [Calothrix sp. MO_167.B12]|nr:penicillin-binding protein 1C [Calothrix sp. MO_167.B12]